MFKFQVSNFKYRLYRAPYPLPNASNNNAKMFFCNAIFPHEKATSERGRGGMGVSPTGWPPARRGTILRLGLRPIGAYAPVGEKRSRRQDSDK
jgi:hypothetical protein